MDKIAAAVQALQAALKNEGIGEITDFVFANRTDVEKLFHVATRDLSLVERQAFEGARMDKLCGVSLIVAT